MPRVSWGLFRWLFLVALLCCFSRQSTASSFEDKTGQNDTRSRIFSPRMDYDEWTPLGRGDPLKNNPTFDYVPPVLDRVQYWLDSHTTEPSAKRDILVLGVTAKKTSPKIPEQFLKFVDGPKFTRNSQESTYRNDFTGSTGAEPPKVLRATNFRNGMVDYRNQNRLSSIPASYYPSPYYNQKTKPYTMMLPPPMVQKPSAEPSTTYNSPVKDTANGYVELSQQFSTQTEEGPILQDTQYYSLPPKNYNQHHLSVPSPSVPPAPSKGASSKGVVLSQIETIKSVYNQPSSQTPLKNRYEATTPSVSFEKSNLIYQSTQTLSGGWLGNNGPTSSSSNPGASETTWQTADSTRDHYELDHHVAASSNHEVVIGQNANIIVDGDNNENEEVVIGQKEILPSVNIVESSNSSDSTDKDQVGISDDVQKEEEKMHIVVANSPSSILDLETHTAKKGPVAVVMPTNYVGKLNSTVQQRTESVPTLQNGNVSGISATPDIMEKATPSSPQMAKPQAFKSTMMSPSMSMFLEDSSASPSQPNWMNQMHHQPQPMPSRYPGIPPHMIGPSISQMSPQMTPQQIARPQPRPNHSIMHFMAPGGRPGGFRPPPAMSMNHLPSPMTHMHAPVPMKTMMVPPMVMEQTHQRPPQIQSFPMTFSTPLPSTTLNFQSSTIDEHPFDHRTSGIPEVTITTTPATYTTTSIEEVYTTASTEGQDRVNLNQSPLSKILSAEENVKETTSERPISPSTLSSQTTTVPSLTTDPIFSHYKQPAKPIRGPMYLIIQGHSKVKTYKPTVSKHGMPVEHNEILEIVTERQLSKLEQLIRENTKGTNGSAEKKKLEDRKDKMTEKKVINSQDTLMSLVENGFNGFTVSPAVIVTEKERQDNTVTTVDGN